MLGNTSERHVQHARVRPSFVPPTPFRELRNLPRYRKTQIEERTREAQRLDKILQDAGVKLSSVASDICGASGRAMLQALVGGTRAPAVLAELAKGALRRKIPALREALEGRFGHHHSLIVSSILAHLEFLDESIDRLSEEIGEAIAPFALTIEMLRTIPGVDRHRRGPGRGDRRGHGPLRIAGATGLLGRAVPGEQRVRRQALLGP